MQPLFDFIVKPYGDRYNNSTSINGKELILNTEVHNHQYVNRFAEVIKTPKHNPTNIQAGDIIVTHHNVFRRWHNMYGIEKNSRGFLNEDEYLVQPDQVFMFKKENWVAMPGYSFIKPIKSKNKYSEDVEQPLVGVVKYSDGTFLPTQLIGFSPNDEYEFIVEGERLYRVMNKFINIEYEYKGDEEEYNPSWAESGGRVNQSC